jgi:ABC-type branched-subunit amino acid transport system substrate-binding protein
MLIAGHLTACRQSRPIVASPVNVSAALPVEDSVPVSHPWKPVVEEKENYRHSLTLGIVMPFYLVENFPEDIPPDSAGIDARSLPALSFLEGALLAADTLSHQDLQLKIRIADNSRDTSAYQWMLMNYSWLRQNDLTYMHFGSNRCEEISRVAARHRLPVVISQCGSITDAMGEYTAVMSPSTATQCREVARFVVKNFPAHEIIVMARATGREKELAEWFIQPLSEMVSGRLLRLNPADTISWLKRLATSSTAPLLILASSDEYLVTAVLHSLNQLAKKITVIGLPTWENFETLHLGGYENLDIICFHATWLDLNDPMIRTFREAFLKKYKTDINWTAWQGYQLTHWLATAAQRADVKQIFKEWFVQQSHGAFENQRLIFIRYSGFDTIRIQTE